MKEVFKKMEKLNQEWDKVFPKSEKVNHKKVTLQKQRKELNICQ